MLWRQYRATRLVWVRVAQYGEQHRLIWVVLPILCKAQTSMVRCVRVVISAKRNTSCPATWSRENFRVDF